MLEALGDITDGFAVDQLRHSLQTATRAEEAGADPEMVVAVAVPRHRQVRVGAQPPPHRGGDPAALRARRDLPRDPAPIRTSRAGTTTTTSAVTPTPASSTAASRGSPWASASPTSGTRRASTPTTPPSPSRISSRSSARSSPTRTRSDGAGRRTQPLTPTRPAGVITSAARAARFLRRPWGRMLAALAAVPWLIVGLPAASRGHVAGGRQPHPELPAARAGGGRPPPRARPGVGPLPVERVAPAVGFNAGAAYPATWLFSVLPGALAWVVNQAPGGGGRRRGHGRAAAGARAVVDGVGAGGGGVLLRRVHGGPERAHRPRGGGRLAAVGLRRPRPPGPTPEGRSATPWVAMLGARHRADGASGAAEPILDGGVVLARLRAVAVVAQPQPGAAGRCASVVARRRARPGARRRAARARARSSRPSRSGPCTTTGTSPRAR